MHRAHHSRRSSGLLLLAVATLLVSAVYSVPSDNDDDWHHLYVRQALPPGWRVVVSFDDDLALVKQRTQVEFHIALKQNNVQMLEVLLYAVSNPDSPQYGQYLTRDEVLHLIKPLPEHRDAVKSWLESNGLTFVDYIDAYRVKAPLSAVEKMFDTKMMQFEHSESGQRVWKHWGPLKLPSALRPAVDMVTGLGSFPVFRRHKAVRPSDNAGDFYVSPYTLARLYNITSDVGIVKHGSSQAPIEFQNDASFGQKELDTFTSNTKLVPVTVTKDHIIGPFTPDYPDVEATLDIQYQVAVAQNATQWYWTVQDWMYEFGVAIANATTGPLVSSMSWGWAESHQCQDVDADLCNQLGVDSQGYVTRVNTEFMKAGARGFTLFVASGDAGAASRVNEDCNNKPALNPDYPACSPYVTSVGATVLDKPSAVPPSPEPICSKYQCATSAGEITCSLNANGCLFTTGGGFSNFASRPDYQTDAVQAYLRSGAQLPPTTEFNTNGRGYPDVAALGHNYLVFVDGGWMAVDGTSASSPAFSGVITILNDFLLKNGKSPVGFANPLLYKMGSECPECFHDITVGSNACTEETCCPYGYGATKGWDAATGLGSPNVGNMIEYLKKLHKL